MNFLCLKEWDPNGSGFPKLTSNLFAGGSEREQPSKQPSKHPRGQPREHLSEQPTEQPAVVCPSGRSRHMTGEKSNFLSLTAAKGGSVAFGNGKSGTIVGIGKIGESLSHSIDCVYLVDGLKYNLLSVS